ncbi:hypothetical protein BIWAKO_03365 [Bosea sp. BIWAKO-01]|nr:hypothetical protein BIWAKO_03365 [Bosea sp. BIWAKO-01]
MALDFRDNAGGEGAIEYGSRRCRSEGLRRYSVMSLVIEFNSSRPGI